MVLPECFQINSIFYSATNLCSNHFSFLSSHQKLEGKYYDNFIFFLYLLLLIINYCSIVGYLFFNYFIVIEIKYKKSVSDLFVVNTLLMCNYNTLLMKQNTRNVFLFKITSFFLWTRLARTYFIFEKNILYFTS